MKRVILIVLVVMGLIGCAGLKYKGWEYVRIEKAVPSSSCEYKLQDVCGSSIVACYNFFKQRATMFDANTVVLKEMTRDGASSSVSPGRVRASSITAMLADYYYCPNASDTLNE